MIDTTGPSDPPGPTAPVPARPAPLPAPTGRDAARTVLATLVGTLLGLAAGVPALVLGGVGYVAVLLATATLGGLAGLWFALVRRAGWGRRELGLVACTRSAWHLLWEVPAALVTGLVAVAVLAPLLGLVPAASEASSVTDTLTAAPWALVVGALCTVLLLPLVEEVVFRRVLLGWLRTRVPVGVAVVVASAAFGAVHVTPVLALYAFFLGLSAAVLALWHRSLWASLALHATNNGLVFLVAGLALTE